MEVLLLTSVRLIYLSWRQRFVGHKYLFLFWKMLAWLTISGVNIGRGLFSAKSWYLLSSNFPRYWPECERYFSSHHKAIYYGNGCSKMPIIEDNGVRRGKNRSPECTMCKGNILTFYPFCIVSPRWRPRLILEKIQKNRMCNVQREYFDTFYPFRIVPPIEDQG